MKKKVVAMLLTVAAVASLGGCGKKEAETVNTTAEVVEIAPVEASESVVVEVPEGGLNADGEYIFVSELYAGRQAVRGNLAHMLAIGEKPLVQSDLPAEKSYFDFLEENWIDASWNDASYAESDVLHENVIAAVKSGIIDRTQATIADYKEIESKMATVYKDIVAEENVINPDYAMIAVCDMAGLNGMNFSDASTTKDAVNIGVMLDGAATLARDAAYRSTPYLNSDTTKLDVDGSMLQAATGYEINYAWACAVGLDTTDPQASLQAAGFAAFDNNLESVALVDYDKAILTNIARRIEIEDSMAAAQSQATTEVAQSGTTTETAQSQPTTVAEQTQPTAAEAQPTAAQTQAVAEQPQPTAVAEQPQTTPAPTQAAAQSQTSGGKNTTDQSLPLHSTVYIEGQAYEYGGLRPDGVVIDNGAFYNNPISGYLDPDEIYARVWEEVKDPATGEVVELICHPDWGEDYDTRIERYYNVLRDTERGTKLYPNSGNHGEW